MTKQPGGSAENPDHSLHKLTPHHASPHTSAVLPHPHDLPTIPTAPTTRTIMRIAMAAFFTAGGIAHIMAPYPFIAITPDWVPFPRQVVFATGIVEIAGSIALLMPRLRWLAGVMLALYALCVWPANFSP